MKGAIARTINRLGFDIRKRERTDLSLYDGFAQDSLLNRRFYNIGAGSFSHPYWTNLDYAPGRFSGARKNPFIPCNLMDRDPLPIGDDTAELVYTSHTIEHVDDEAVRTLLSESFRVLKPGGGIRLATPDADLEFQAYQRRDIRFWYWKDALAQPGSWEDLYRIPLSEASIHQLFLYDFACQVCGIGLDDSAPRRYTDAEICGAFAKDPDVRTLDFFTRQCRFNPEHTENHMNWWTFEKLSSFLKEAGFPTVYRSGFGQSLFAPLRETHLFDNTVPKLSLYVEAIKGSKIYRYLAEILMFFSLLLFDLVDCLDITLYNPAVQKSVVFHVLEIGCSECTQGIMPVLLG